MDQLLATGLAQAGIPLSRFVISERDQTERRAGGIRFLPLKQAYETLLEEFRQVDIVQFNGSFDPYASFAAAEAGVPALVEIMHMRERGGMHPETDCVVAVSKLVAREQTHAFCRVIPNGVDVGRFSFKAGRRAPGRAKILQVANQAKQLRFSLDELIPDIVAENPHTGFIAVGGRELRPHATLESYGARSDMEALYHNADLNLLACENDAFGLTLAEGMACGCLPIASANGGGAEFIEHGLTGWLVDGGKDEWLRNIREALEVLGSPAHAAMQERVRERIVQGYSREKCAAAYVELFQDLHKRFPKRRERRSGKEYRALYESAFLQRIDPARALERLADFTLGGKPLPKEFLQHPNCQSAVALALQMLNNLEQIREVSLLARSFCALLRASRVSSPLLDALENKIKGSR